jgi:DNA-binding transcriptional regulator YdaS (Cro superfamily)
MIKTVDEVIKELGGPTAAASVLGVTPPALCNWSVRGVITAEHFLLIREALAERGLEVSPSVFSFKAPVEAAE